MFVEFPERAKHTAPPKQNPKTTYAGQNEESAYWSRSLAAKEILFRVGDRRINIYRVETGAICLYEPRWNDERSIVDIAFPGDFVGLGFLETQSYSASAICECQVRCMPWGQLTSAVAGNFYAQQKLQEAIEREFELRRTSIVQLGHRYPIERVAAFLIALSRNNAAEGRDPSIIGESMECGIAADYLGMGVEDLGALLVDLRKRGLIDLCPAKGLLLLDIAALDELANLHDDPISMRQPHERAGDHVRFSQRQGAWSNQLHAA
jgi:CRP/FNR family transcriptional regulator